MGLPAGRFRVLLDSSAPEYGAGTGPARMDAGGLRLSGRQAVVLEVA